MAQYLLHFIQSPTGVDQERRVLVPQIVDAKVMHWTKVN